MDNKIEYSKPVPPFVKFCAANIPMVFDDSLSYYECLCALWKWLQTDVIDVINNNAQVTQVWREELTEFEGDMTDKFNDLNDAFDTLKNWIDTYFDNLDVQEEINNKLDAMVEDGTLQEIVDKYLGQFIEETNVKLDTLPVNDESKVILYSFFNDNNHNLNFYVSEDGVKLKKLDTGTTLTADDSSLIYKDGKFYMAYTHHSTTYDFGIKVSEDLVTWEEHNINVGLYDSTYSNRWAPEWFEDDNGKLYIIISVQYANTEGWGDFRPYLVECTNLETLTFDSPRRMYLNNSPADNHIDASVAKYNGVYHMIVKSEHQTELYLEHFTSTNLVDWDYVDADPTRFGRLIEAPDIVKFNNKYYIYGEEYTGRTLDKGNYLLSCTTDFQNYTNPVNVVYPDIDLSHGGGVVIEKKVLNKLLTNGNLKLVAESTETSKAPCTTDFWPVAKMLTDTNAGTGQRLGNYLHLFDITDGSSYRTYNVMFHISSGTSKKVSGTYELMAVVESGVTVIRLTEISTNCEFGTVADSLAGKIIAVQDNVDTKKVKVYVDLTTAQFNPNEAVNLSIINSQVWFGKIIKYRDNFTDSIVTTDVKKVWANGSPNSRTVVLDMYQKHQATITFASRNGSIDVFGNVNGTTTDRILNGKIIVQSGNIAYKNFNPELSNAGQAITVSLVSYDSDKSEYTIKFENVPGSSSLGLTIPPQDRSYIKSATTAA